MQNSDVKILLVDDEPDILEILSFNLEQEGYHVITAENGKIAVDLAIKEKPNLIVLDIMMPIMNGIEACEELRKIDDLKQTIITFLTARNEEYSQMAGFNVGADDYITKPIKPKLFVSKIHALLRRLKGSNSIQINSDSELIVGSLKINREKYHVVKNDVKIVLPKKEFELLYLLASKPNKVFTRDEILDKIWGNDVVVGGRTIDVHIRKLREKIDDEMFKTIKGVGYKFEAE